MQYTQCANHIFSYTLRGGDFDNAGRISTSLKRELRTREYPPHIIQRVAIVLYEAEINVVSYTKVGYFFAYCRPNSVHLVIKDKGKGIENIRLAVQEGFSTATDEIRRLGFGAGMGLSNIKRNANVMRICSKPGEGTKISIDITSSNHYGDLIMDITVNEIQQKTNFELLTSKADCSKLITGGYVGDMLSDVNANGKKGNIWITILTHPNAVAVASLKDFSAIVVAGGIKPREEFIKRAEEEDIPVLYTDLSAYEVVVLLSSLGVTANH
ncbi:MAG: ATP-binding protein [Spirochaetota bacterium]